MHNILLKYIFVLLFNTNIFYTMKSIIFSTAWELFRGGIFLSFGEALKAAWNKSKLQKALKSGVSVFMFRKADGTERKAVGTLNASNFTYEAKAATGEAKEAKKANATIVKFWDMENWRFVV